MSFRYKSALLSLISMALIYGWFFVTLMTDQHSRALAHVGRLAMTVVILAVVMAVGHILLEPAPER